MQCIGLKLVCFVPCQALEVAFEQRGSKMVSYCDGTTITEEGEHKTLGDHRGKVKIGDIE